MHSKHQREKKKIAGVRDDRFVEFISLDVAPATVSE